MTTCKCKCACGATFTAKVADRRRGWARSCSKTCAAKRREKRNGHQFRRRETEADDMGHWGHPMASGYEGHGQS